MKKYGLLLLVLVVTLSFCGCNATENTSATENMIGTKNGVAYLNNPAKTPDITYTCYSDGEEKEVKIEDITFYDKLKEIIDGKPAGEEFCKCAGDYQVTIDDKYLLYLHTERIVVYTNLIKHSGFTVECSQEETKELYDIIESKK